MRAAAPDHYATLGVEPGADAAELRRAYRRLALRHHPDLAGADATEVFARIAEAYRVLSDPRAREVYDARGGAERPRPPAPPPPEDAITRLCGALDALAEAGAARLGDDGVLELRLTRSEADLGGVAAIDMALPLPCPTCGGLAERHRLWCARCEFAGTVTDEVTVLVEIPPLVSDGAMFAVAIDRAGRVPPLRVRVRR